MRKFDTSHVGGAKCRTPPIPRSLVAQLVKNPPAMRETWVWSLGWEDPLEKGKGYPFQYSRLENSMDYMAPGFSCPSACGILPD